MPNLSPHVEHQGDVKGGEQLVETKTEEGIGPSRVRSDSNYLAAIAPSEREPKVVLAGV
jgi:hypothetical protein